MKFSAKQFFFLPVLIGSVIKLISGRSFKSAITYFVVYLALSFGIGQAFNFSYPTIGNLINLYLFIGMIYTIFFHWRDKDIDSEGALGKAVFSSTQDLRAHGLIGNGVVLGKKDGVLVEKPDTKEGHTLIIGGTGTGKTRGHGIPTLLRWTGTGLVIDIKGELSDRTAHAKPDSIVFSTEKQLARYNPLDFVQEIEDVQEIGRNMFPAPKQGDPFWAQCAQSVFSAACWEYRHEKSFAEVAQFICAYSEQEVIETLLKSEKIETKILANTVANLKPEVLAGIFAEIRGKLATIAVDKNIQYATSRSDFSPSDIEKSMIYLQVSEHRLKQYGEIFTVIIGQFLRYLTKREEGKTPPVLIMLDEFPRLGKMSEVVGGLATLRSRNVHLMLIIQSLAQLDNIYGNEERKVIVDNCSYKLVINATDTDTQKYFSDMAGQKTVKLKSYSQQEGHRKEQTFTTQEQSVPLIRPEEFGVLEKPILFAYRLRPVELERAFWDQDEEMRSLVNSKLQVS
ncbi:type IV secretory system conjugative DNA transfer family protein [Mesobacillus sp.]|uniref:type IV secretory system conjugative DNA transfer family protein n=1 Tax=Mesobacillus sp. TaxID=2675271 RepID=UPI0039F0C9DE